MHILGDGEECLAAKNVSSVRDGSNHNIVAEFHHAFELSKYRTTEVGVEEDVEVRQLEAELSN
jgi:hypothetical protein